jgi:asparagine synthase (glutamine-hydrolysing)
MCGFLFYSGTKLDQGEFSKALEKISHRGPDDTEVVHVDNKWMGFKRLAIMDLSHKGDQPFSHEDIWLVCNGEIYNFEKLEEEFNDYQYISKSDCEVLLPIYKKEGIKGIAYRADGEYAVVIYDSARKGVFAARDAMGIRPLFYGHTNEGEIVFASEVKALQDLCQNIKPFPPGHYYENGNFYSYKDLSKVEQISDDSHEVVYKKIHDKLVEAVKKRLHADAPMGYLLSGGLDSSLVCAIAQKYTNTPIKTFAIGMSEDAIDLKYAKEVADYIKSDHTEVIIDRVMVLSAIRKVIYHLETWDITTVRASIGMYLVCEWIRKNTKIKALMTGEVSDEIFGYKYTDFAPSAEEFQKEAAKRVRELYIYDVLRADRCISANSLEARVPFSDSDFVQYVMSIDPAKKLNTYGHGKYLLRKAFEGYYLPHSILYREKAAFSDAVGHSMVEELKKYAEEIYSDDDYVKGIAKYDHGRPFTKESLLYREIFEEFYPQKGYLINDFWMPNKEWKNCDVKDPSARVLPNYGASGA